MQSYSEQRGDKTVKEICTSFEILKTVLLSIDSLSSHLWYELTLSSAYRHCKSSLGEGNQVPKIAYPSVLKGGKKHGMFCKRIFSPMFPGPWCDPQVQTSVGNLSRPKRKSPLWKKSYKWFITFTNCRGLLNKKKWQSDYRKLQMNTI